MKVTKLSVNGHVQEVSAIQDGAYPSMELKKSIQVTGGVRGLATAQELSMEKDDLLELVFDDETKWLCPPDALEDIYPGSITQNRSGEAVFELPSDLSHTDTERGLIGSISLRVLNLFTRKAVARPLQQIARDLEEKQLGNFKGLVRVNRNFQLEKPDVLTPSSPFLLFIHGTNSSTEGSFAELLGTELWSFIVQTYGNNILAFQHETMTKSPLQNAFELAGQLPLNARLHIITHSRGGLVGEILARFNGDSMDSPGFSRKEKDMLRKEGRAADIEYIEKLQEVYLTKNFSVKKFIRVACPTSGTTILSKRLDYFFNISLNLLGLATGASLNPIYVAMQQLLTAVIDQKNDPHVLPGLEAMNPDSPFITLLNNQSGQVAIGEMVIAISGNAKMKLNLKALAIIASKLFYFEDNDLVVNTKSMYNGSRRRDKLQYFFDEGGDVDHFHYFKNKKTNSAILQALKFTGTGPIDGFTVHLRGKIGEAERNAMLGLEGGQYFVDHPTGKKPIVILLPGIMGSTLTRNNDLVWINYLGFLAGGLDNIRSDAAGVEATSIVKTSYRRLGEFLRNDYDVVTFPFDWRLSLADMTHKLDAKVRSLLEFNQPIKMIGHSMGGVLVRDFMAYFPDTWKALSRTSGFRVLFLGSPLGGSFRIANVLFGEDDILRKLNSLDIVHSKRELVELFARFPGLLSLLPFNTDAANDFSDPGVWAKMKDAYGDNLWPGPETADLANFKNYRDFVLKRLSEIDYSNAVYIAGKDKHTPCGYRIDDTIRGPELVLLSTGEGDQSVTWESGIPKAMLAANSVYYVNYTHGELSDTPGIFNGIKEILVKGSTQLLSRTRPVVRSEEKVFKRPDTYDFDLSPEGVENTLLGIGEKTELADSELPVSVKVTHGDLKYAAYPLLAGHFKNDSILYGEEKIDRLLGGVLKQRHLLGLYPGDIGSSEMLLTRMQGFPGALIVGLGEPGLLTAFQLTRTVEQAVSRYLLGEKAREKLRNPTAAPERLGISSLIIGCGYGGLSIENSISAIIEGVLNANDKVKKLDPENLKLVEVLEFIELYEDRALSSFYSIVKMAKEFGGAFNISSERGITTVNGARKRVNLYQNEQWWNRITIGKTEDHRGEVGGMRFTLSTGAAREELRTIFTGTGIVEQLVEGISTDNNWTDEKARAIFELLIPNDFKSRLKKHGNITWVLDKYTARFPWELLQDSTPGAKPLCINAGMIRQMATQDYRVNIEPVYGKKALVIGDPDLKGFITQLPGALEEAKAVAGLLTSNGYETRALFNESSENIIPALFSSPFKIIHLAGHGVFSSDLDKGSGMVIGKNNYLTTAEISQMSTTPELVFVNCCYLGKTDGVAEELFRSRFKLAANIGTQLIENGVKAVIVAGWVVNDAAALAFANQFYTSMFEGNDFGAAVKCAREELFKNFSRNNTWGAYQCYGDPFYKLVNEFEQKTEQARDYVIAEQAEIDLSNLLNELGTGDTQTEIALKELEAISKSVDKQQIRNPAITEMEAMIYATLNNYEKAIEHFERLLAFENAAYSFTAMEKYCNLRAKHFINLLTAGKPGEEIEKLFGKVIDDLKALVQLKPSAERYNLLGSAYKRKLQFHKKNKTNTMKTLEEASKNYYLAYAFGNKGDGFYAYTNWVVLENLLVLAGDRHWGDVIKDKNGEVVYTVPLPEKIIETLQTFESRQGSERSFAYWDMIRVPNVRLCSWILQASDVESGKSPDPAAVLDSYLEVWNKAGTAEEKTTEIQHLDLLIDAITAILKEHPLKSALEGLRKALAGEVRSSEFGVRSS